ncbi:MAG: sigma-70 family RNA polymerase sigma factor, partial [Coriobacteriia bacterium]|nr:sigma-70 family RNA polymerase sigma factor [Coriobacteriia bacterium]
MAMTEQQIKLVVAAQNGDSKSFGDLFALYYDKVYALIRMILKNSNDAEDVLQETFITAWRKLNTLETPLTFSVWIQVIARNHCNMVLRKKNMAILLDAEQEIEDFDTEDSSDLLPAVYTERADLKERLGRIIDGLSEVQRQAIVLYYFNGMSVSEIADMMECSVNTVKTRLYLARKAIRSEVEEQERRSGEKFYGLAGIPMLPFGNVMYAHLQSLSIGKGAASVTLQAIMNSISGSGGAAATSAVAPGANAVAPGANAVAPGASAAAPGASAVAPGANAASTASTAAPSAGAPAASATAPIASAAPVAPTSAEAPAAAPATVPMSGTATVPMSGSATVPMSGSATVPMSGSATVPMSGSAAIPMSSTGAHTASGIVVKAASATAAKTLPLAAKILAGVVAICTVS